MAVVYITYHHTTEIVVFDLSKFRLMRLAYSFLLKEYNSIFNTNSVL